MAFENSLDPFKLLIQAAATGEFKDNSELADLLADNFPAPDENFEPPNQAPPLISPDILSQLAPPGGQETASTQAPATPPINLPSPGQAQLRLPIQPNASGDLASVLQGSTPDFLTAALPFLSNLLNQGKRPQQAVQGQPTLSELGNLFGGV